MGLFSTLNTGVTGLQVNSVGMNVIGDNIANVNTAGFKSNRVQFDDLLVQNVIGSSGNTQLGRGATVGGISLNFAQGTFENSPNVTDMAINGQGFFVVRVPDSQEQLYTRAGQFYLAADGNLVTTHGNLLQGYNANAAGELGTIIEDIKLETAIQSPSDTTAIAITANLDSRTAAETVAASQITVTNTYFQYEDLNTQADFSSSVTIYDSLGQPHDVTAFYQKVADNEWNFVAVVNTSEVDGGVVASGDAYAIANGNLIFDTNGNLDTTASTINDTTLGVQFSGAAAQAIDFDFSTNGALTQYGDNSALTATSQDGYGPGYLSYLDIDNEGVITGVYSNGQRNVLAEVALANFQSPAGLERRGTNMLGATADSKAPAVGAPNTGGRGEISSNALELSNVDLEAEFVRMISTQLGYQANSKVVSTTDEMLRQLIQIV